MKILVLSFYYSPDLCAGSFRCTQLVQSLQKKLGNHVKINVMTTKPNRYASFDAEAPNIEEYEGICIERIDLPVHQSGMLDQARAFVHFAMAVNRLIKDRDFDMVLATSSRLMTAALGAWVARKKNAKLYLDIRDLFVDTLDNVLSKKLSIGLKPVFSLIERWTMHSAQRINLVSKGFEEYFKKHYPLADLRWYSNGIDETFIMQNMPDLQHAIPPLKPLTVVYAGNIGEGQGLHHIIPKLAKRMESRIRFKVIGDGGKKKLLMQALLDLKCMNVELVPPIKREQLIQEYQQADILFLHLNDYPAFCKVLPSKLFEYGAMGKPIWAGVSGYAAQFIESELENAVIFHPCDERQAEIAFSNLSLGYHPRSNFIEKYARSCIMDAMASDIYAFLLF